MKRMTMKFMALALLMVAGTASVFAQGVAFTSTSLPRQMRQEGITETAGEIVLTAINAGTIPPNSTIDIVFSVAITNNSTASTGNISVGNNVTAVGAAAPAAATLTGTQTIRLQYVAATAFAVGNSINISRVRVNANAAVGVGTVTATMSGISSDPALFPITFTDPQRQVGVLNPTVQVRFNSSSTPVTFYRTCSFPNVVANDFYIRINELFPGAITTTAQETVFAPNLAPVNGSQLTLTISNVPAGLTLTFNGLSNQTAGTTWTTGNVTANQTSVDQTVAGVPISFVLTFTVTDTSLVEEARFNFSLKPTTTSTTNPLPVASIGSPVNVQGSVSVTPITTTDSVIVRFAANQAGPTTLAVISDCTTRILMTWVATVADVETGVALNNTSSDDAAFGSGPLLGATAQNGTCTLTGYPSAGGTPVSFTTATINAGSSLAFLLSATTGFSNFTGYVLTVCNFEAGHAFTFITNGRGTVTGPTLAQGYVANIIQPGTRPTAAGASESLGN